MMADFRLIFCLFISIDLLLMAAISSLMNLRVIAQRVPSDPIAFIINIRMFVLRLFVSETPSSRFWELL